jgi:hypothetical protein
MIFAIILDISNYTIHIPNTGIVLPPPILTATDITTSVFSGSITGCSILIGFFAISAHNFRNSLQSEIDRLWEDIRETTHNYVRLVSRKKEIDSQKGSSETKAELEEKIKENEEYQELLQLNHDALAHQQEHIGKFLLSYLLVSVFLFIIDVNLFDLCGLSSIFDFYCTSVCVIWFYSTFVGLSLFLYEFLNWEHHQEFI